jgi:hypothetical protein
VRCAGLLRAQVAPAVKKCRIYRIFQTQSRCCMRATQSPMGGADRVVHSCNTRRSYL